MDFTQLYLRNCFSQLILPKNLKGVFSKFFSEGSLKKKIPPQPLIRVACYNIIEFKSYINIEESK